MNSSTNVQERKILIAPSILSGNFARIEDEVRKIEQAGADFIHLDVMDGCFVPNITFGPKMVADIRKITSLPLDAHLMIVNPEKYAERFVEAGADYVTIHTEAASDPIKTLQDIKNKGAKCGIALNPDSDTAKIMDCYAIADLVLIMSVFPGFSGQKYIEGSDKRVSEARRLLQKHSNHTALIQIDGGISEKNARLVHDAGADVLVMGNAFFLANDPRALVKTIKQGA